ncbi:VOC family protein [Novosphingobium flavum]|uniref:VOC family protein n=1 Tax=Novosphingobium flavum TaxID=1778672 RepID=A0A7X1KN11_9SPHN|nr:VOC family protein [Novosphingobium flavum]MBC2667214.1 VOC family protein [Novosphingobium flavum]
MFTHITVGSNDVPASQQLYDALFTALGGEPGVPASDGSRVRYIHKGGVLLVTKPVNGEPATFGNGVTIGFQAESPEQIDAWHAAGIANGGTTAESPPGERNGPFGHLYLAYLRDQTGNKLCAVYRYG